MTGPAEFASPEAPGQGRPWDETEEELYDRAPCGYLSTLPDGTIVKVNGTFLTWTGYARADLVGRRRFRDLLTGGGRIYFETHVAPLLRMQGEAFEIAFDVVRADGHRLPTLVNSTLGRDADGHPRIIRITVFDATHRRRYEQELLHARRAAEASENRVRVLQQTVADLAASPTEIDVAAAVVRAPAAAFDAAGATVWLVDRDLRGLVLAASTEQAGSTVAQVPLSSPFAGVVHRADVRVARLAPNAEPVLPEFADQLRRWGRQTALVAPLATHDAVLGVLAFTFAGSRDISDAELRLVRLLGHQAGQALERARLYDEARLRESRAVLLAETTRAMDEAHEVLPRARHLLDRLVPAVMPWASVRLRGAAAALAEAGKPPAHAAGLVAEVSEAVATGEPVVVAAAPGGADHRVVLPLTVRGKVLGTLALRLPAAGRPAQAELPFLRDVADRAALALENARLYEQQRDVAETLQRSLLADVLPTDRRFAIETHYRTATQGLQVGGDWYDAFLITGDKLAIVVGDVVGRGIEAASTMGQLRSAIRALAATELGPARLLERLDRFVDRLPSAHMATVAYAEIVLSTGEMVYSCAGHMPPLLHAPGADPQLLWGGRSAPLGSRVGRTARVEDTLPLPAGARLLLYTDGLIERRDRLLDEGFALLSDALGQRRDAPLAELVTQLADALVGTERRDDVCLLCLRFGAEPRLERVIPADATQIAALRKDLRGWLGAHDVDEDTGHAVVLACSEAVANAIEHGYRDDPAGVVVINAVRTTDGVQLRVSDRGSWRPERADVARGRGLFMIRQLMDDVTVETDGGTTITMRLRTKQEKVA